MKITINLDEWTVTEERNPVNIKLVALKGDKGDTGNPGTVSFDELTPEQIAMLKGDPGDDYVLTSADKEEIAGIVEEDIAEDTGWIDLSDDVNSTNWTVGLAVQVRRVGEVVCWRGSVTLKNALASRSAISIFDSGVIPSKFRPNTSDYIRMPVVGNYGLYRLVTNNDGGMTAMNLTGAEEASGHYININCMYMV